MENIIVVDTSIVISALIGKEGSSREVIRLCLKGELKPLVSNSLFLEYEDVTKRKRILELYPLTLREIRELLNALYSVCKWVPIYYLLRSNLKDEADNFLIELALAGNALKIITNNISDLENAELNFPNLEILTPETLLRGR